MPPTPRVPVEQHALPVGGIRARVGAVALELDRAGVEELPHRLLGEREALAHPGAEPQRAGNRDAVPEFESSLLGPPHDLLLALIELARRRRQRGRLLGATRVGEELRRDLGAVLGHVAPAAAHADLVGPQFRALVDRELRPLGRPLPVPGADERPRGPGCEDPAPQILLGEVELA